MKKVNSLLCALSLIGAVNATAGVQYGAGAELLTGRFEGMGKSWFNRDKGLCQLSIEFQDVELLPGMILPGYIFNVALGPDSLQFVKSRHDIYGDMIYYGGEIRVKERDSILGAEDFYELRIRLNNRNEPVYYSVIESRQNWWGTYEYPVMNCQGIVKR